jgi:hypothetical protein
VSDVPDLPQHMPKNAAEVATLTEQPEDQRARTVRGDPDTPMPSLGFLMSYVHTFRATNHLGRICMAC